MAEFDLDAYGAAFDPPERSGTFNLTGLDGEFYEKLMGFMIPAPTGPLPRYTVSVTTRPKVPCPRLWRHPLRWLRWNPLLLEPPMTVTFYDAEFEVTDDRAG